MQIMVPMLCFLFLRRAAQKYTLAQEIETKICNLDQRAVLDTCHFNTHYRYVARKSASTGNYIIVLQLLTDIKVVGRCGCGQN